MGLPLPRLSSPKLLQVRTFWNHYFIPIKWSEMRVVKMRGEKNVKTTRHLKTMSECSFKSWTFKPPDLTSHGTSWKALRISRREKKEPVFATASFPFQWCLFSCLDSSLSRFKRNEQKDRSWLIGMLFSIRMSLHKMKQRLLDTGAFIHCSHII